MTSPPRRVGEGRAGVLPRAALAPELSIGDYALSGGDVAAFAVFDSNPQNRMSALLPKTDGFAMSDDNYLSRE